MTAVPDLSCFDDLDTFGAELTDPIAILEQDIYHILLEITGSNLDDPDNGFGLENALSGAADPTLGKRIEAQLVKDSRIRSAKCDVTPSTTSNGPVVYTIAIRVETDDGVLGLVLTSDGTALQVQ